MHLLSGTPIANLAPGIAARPVLARTAAELAPLVGTYELGPSIKLVVTQDGERLFWQINSQPKAELFAQGPDDFFLKSPDAQVTFQRDAAGAVTGLMIHQANRHVPGRRITP
jgi:serine-type D-Ala-D-Ala carboxypeptidase/endopeptidase